MTEDKAREVDEGRRKTIAYLRLQKWLRKKHGEIHSGYYKVDPNHPAGGDTPPKFQAHNPDRHNGGKRKLGRRKRERNVQDHSSSRHPDSDDGVRNDPSRSTPAETAG